MARLLITGGAGFIGANFVHHWTSAHPDDRLVILDALTYAGNLSSIASALEKRECRFVHGNINDRELVERLLREERIDTIVHFAAESHVDRSIRGPDIFLETNVIGTHCLLSAARQVWLDEGLTSNHRFHHVSTDEVYGSLGENDPPFTETTAYAPNSPYSATKAASDHLVRAYHETFGLRVTTTNCSNNYGPLQFPEKLIPLLIVNVLQGKPLPIYGDGRNVRDWLFVADHCRGIDLVLKNGEIGEVYNIGGCAERDNLFMVRTVCELADEIFASNDSLRQRFPMSPAAGGQKSESLIEFVRDRPGHDRRYAIDCSKIQKKLNFAPGRELRDGLRQTFQWYLNNESWWRAVISGSYRQWMASQYQSS